MMTWTRIFAAGAILILLTNAVVLLGAAYNRSGEPESSLRLTQRELHQDSWRPDKDNSGMTLSLNWLIEQAEMNEYNSGSYSGHWGRPVWLDKSKLVQLGFDAEKLVPTPEYRPNYRELQPREVYLVLEMDGPAYRRHLQRTQEYAEECRKKLAATPGNAEAQRRAKSADESYKYEQVKGSRLFVVDAGLDPVALRTAYPDRNRYAILRGLVRPAVYGGGKDAGTGGTIDDLYADRINVPFAFRQAFEDASAHEASVAFGRRLEPWIVAASKGTTVKPPEENQ